MRGTQRSAARPGAGVTGPRWLDDEESAAWFALGGVLMWLPVALDAQLQTDAGISHFEYQVLAMLSMSPDRTARMGQLAGLANGSQSRLSHVVGRFEERGWVTRRPDSVNGRIVLATLTDAGWEKVVDTAPGHVEAVRRYVFDTMTPAQTRELHQILGRILAGVRPESCVPPLDS